MSDEMFNQDAELGILNIIMSNPDVVYSTHSLKHFMFGSSPNILIYSTIQELAEQSYLPDYNLVGSKLESKSKLREAGGIEYLNYIKTLSYKKENLNELIRQITDAYKARSLISASVDVQGKIKKGEPVAEVMAELRHSLENLETTSGGEQVVDLKTASEETWKNITERINSPGIRGITTGSKGLDVITGGYNPGDLIILAGRPSMGKSTDMCNYALSIAKAGHGVLIFSLEAPRTDLVERLLAMESGVPLSDIRLGTLSQKQLDLVSDAIKKIKDLPIYIDTNYYTDENYFTTTTRKYKALKDVSIVFLDYVQLAVERSSTQTADLGSFSRTAKLLANDLGITVVMLSQLNRSVELRDDKRPILSDLRQSGNLEEDADIAIFLYRDEVYYKNTKDKGALEKIIRKNRNGPTGTLFYKFDELTLSITE